MHNSDTKAAASLLTAGASSASASSRLNDSCHCVSIDIDASHAALASALGTPELVTLVEERCPFLFAASPVFISAEQFPHAEGRPKL